MAKPEATTTYPERKLQEPDFHVVGSFSLEQPPEWEEKAPTGSDRPVVYATASSTANDLDSDRMDQKALEVMAERFVGVTVFLNHRYNWPEDVFGTILRTRLVDRDGALDLDMEIAVEDQNPRALQSYKMIQNGTRAGVSVGVLVLDYETIDEKHLGRKIIVIKDVLPLEASVVGIPSNQRSWVHEAIKAMMQRGMLKLSCDEQGCRPWLATITVIDDLTLKVWEETENEIRYRIRNPDLFDSDSFRRITIKKDKPRVFAIIGKLEGEDTTTLQALRFPKGDGWTLAEAKKWVKEHKDELKSVDDEEINVMANAEELAVIASLDEDERAALADLVTLIALNENERAALNTLDEEAVATLQALASMDEEALAALESMADLDDETVAALVASAECACGEHTPGFAFALRGLKSLADELAEMEFSSKFWRLTYAFCDAIWDVIEHKTGEARTGGVDRVISEYRNLLLGLVSTLPDAVEPEQGTEMPAYSVRESFGLQALHDITCLMADGIKEKAGARNNAGDTTLIQTVHDTVVSLGAQCADEKSAGVDKDGPSSETGDEVIRKAVADLTERSELVIYDRDVTKQENERLQKEITDATALVEEILDLPLELKTADGQAIRDAARDIAKKRYPDLSPAVSSLLTEDE